MKRYHPVDNKMILVDKILREVCVLPTFFNFSFALRNSAPHGMSSYLTSVSEKGFPVLFILSAKLSPSI